MSTSRGPTISLLMLCVLGALVHSSSAITHTVSWDIPSSTTFYNDWAATETFQVGDVIVFSWTVGHNVLAVSAKDLASCEISNPLMQWDDASPKVTLDKPGAQNFICGVPGHCELGMSVTIQVLAPAPVPAPPAPKVAPPTKPPPATPATPETAPPPPKPRSSPPPKPEAPVEAPVPSPPKKKKSKSPVPAPLAAPSIAPAPLPIVAGASLLKSTAFGIISTLVVSCWAILF